MAYPLLGTKIILDEKKLPKKENTVLIVYINR